MPITEDDVREMFRLLESDPALRERLRALIRDGSGSPSQPDKQAGSKEGTAGAS